MTAQQAKQLLQDRQSIWKTASSYEHLIKEVFASEVIRKQYQQEMDKALQTIAYIDLSLLRIPDTASRRVLMLHYVEQKKWTDVQDELGYFTIKSIYRNANKGYRLFAKEFEKLEAEDRNCTS